MSHYPQTYASVVGLSLAMLCPFATGQGTSGIAASETNLVNNRSLRGLAWQWPWSDSSPLAAGSQDEKREKQWAMLNVLTNYDPQGYGWNKNFSWELYKSEMNEVLCEDAYLHHNLVGDWGPRDVFVEYSAISDYSINGHYKILGATILNDTIVWDGDIVRYNVSYHSSYFILGAEREFHTITQDIVTFARTSATDPGCISEVNATDGEPMKAFSQVGAPETPRSTCAQISENCGSLYNPFDEPKKCQEFYSTLPWQCATGFGKGNSWVCRNLHVYTSKVAPEVHCNHTRADSGPPGPGGEWSHSYHGGYCRDIDCEGSRYCHDMLCLVRGNCVEDPETYLMTCQWEWLSWWQNVPNAIAIILDVIRQIINTPTLIFMLVVFVLLLCWCLNICRRSRHGDPLVSKQLSPLVSKQLSQLNIMAPLE